MSSNVQLTASSAAAEGELPFASYAQIVRMLLPLTDKVSFYDASGKALWISDGMEEPELRMHVEILLARCRDEGSSATPVDYSTSDEGQPTYVFPIRTKDTTFVGAIAVVFRDLPAGTTYRRLETVERLLAPLLDVLSHGYRLETEDSKHTPALTVRTVAPPPQLEEAAVVGSPLPATLRRTLALASQRLQCAFGAVIGVERPFLLSHRLSPDDSDLAMNSAIEAVRGPMLKLMQVRKDAVLVNGSAPGRTPLAPYKFLVLPVRPAPDRLAALVMLFRHKQDRDFIPADAHELLELVTTRFPSVTSEPSQPKPATVPISSPSDSERPARELSSTVVTVPISAPVPVLQTSVSSKAQSSASPQPKNADSSRQSPVSLVITADAAPTMDDRIRRALRDGAFNLYAQKISPLRNEQRPARFEVLLRMQDAQRLRPPSSFFEAAEAGTLMPDLDRWVIRSLLSTLRANAGRVRSGRLEFCINIAAQSLVADRFSDFIVAEVCKSSIPAGLLVFEVSESDALEHQHALEFLGARLRDVGCRIALDNCRAGLTTFGPLHKWPVSCVKIDGSLIRNVTTSKRSESIVRAVAQLASSMGIETVAERVESPELCEKLLDIGFDYAQGFHFGQPQPLAAVFG